MDEDGNANPGRMLDMVVEGANVYIVSTRFHAHRELTATRRCGDGCADDLPFESLSRMVLWNFWTPVLRPSPRS